ncbi:MAG: hypothetical protein JXB10_09100 [Pirellulales bacterium]|nr:hypothetical protein [Pirellulales bacterium]
MDLHAPTLSEVHDAMDFLEIQKQHGHISPEFYAAEMERLENLLKALL